MKWILDGTPIERLAFLRAPYLDAPGERGRLNLTSDRLEQFVGWAYGSEDSLAVHAVGDGAIDAYVTAIEKAGRAEVWRGKRPRIEHGDMMPPDLIARVKAMGMVVVQNPLHFMSGEILAARVGPERRASMQPMKSLLEAGVPLAIGADGPMNPFLNIMAATTHPANPKEALTREQAVTAYTSGSAFAEFQGKGQKGQLALGMLADLAVLSVDIFTVPPPELPRSRACSRCSAAASFTKQEPCVDPSTRHHARVPRMTARSGQVFGDLRSFLDQLRRDRELVEISAPVDAKLEAAEIHRRVIAAGGPALLFTNVKGADFRSSRTCSAPRVAPSWRSALDRSPLSSASCTWLKRCCRRRRRNSGAPATLA